MLKVLVKKTYFKFNNKPGYIWNDLEARYPVFSATILINELADIRKEVAEKRLNAKLFVTRRNFTDGY